MKNVNVMNINTNSHIYLIYHLKEFKFKLSNITLKENKFGN